MKKSKRTIMTAALLSAAVTMQSQIKAPSTGNESEAAVLYGPPWVFYDKGDVNMDNKTNIVDLILLKSNGTGQKETSYWEELADLDGDAKISRTDIRMMERFLFGAASNVNEQLPNEDEDIVPQPEYGTPVIEPSYQTKYGCPPSLVTEPAVTEPETDPTFWNTGMQPKYGIPPIDPSFVPLDKPVTTFEEEVIPQPAYGAPVAEPSEEPAYTEEPSEPEYGEEPIQLVYGPPSYFMDEDK